MNNVLKYYYYGHPIIPNFYNFGDLVTPVLMQHYCSEVEILPAKTVAEADIFCVGSIVQQIPEDKFVIILGSGIIWNRDRRLPQAKIYALRGPNTKKKLGIMEDVPFGDPALLLPRIWPTFDNNYKEKPIGIVPHSVHFANERIDRFRADPRFKVINVRAEPKYVVQDICSCSSIISSSMHGLIIADAYGIPNVRLDFGDELLVGGDFKFEDYYLSIGREGMAAKSITPEEISVSLTYETEYQKNIPAVQDKLEAAFRQFVDDFSLLCQCKTVQVCKQKKKEQEEASVKESINLIKRKMDDFGSQILKIQKEQQILKARSLNVWLLLSERTIFLRFRFYQIMSRLTWGVRRERYKRRKKLLRSRLRDIRKIRKIYLYEI